MIRACSLGLRSGLTLGAVIPLRELRLLRGRGLQHGRQPPGHSPSSSLLSASKTWGRSRSRKSSDRTRGPPGVFFAVTGCLNCIQGERRQHHCAPGPSVLSYGRFSATHRVRSRRQVVKAYVVLLKSCISRSRRVFRLPQKLSANLGIIASSRSGGRGLSCSFWPRVVSRMRRADESCSQHTSRSASRPFSLSGRSAGIALPRARLLALACSAFCVPASRRPAELCTCRSF